MSKEKIKEVMKAIDRLPGMDTYSKGIMAGYMLGVKSVEERYKKKEMEDKKDINKN